MFASGECSYKRFFEMNSEIFKEGAEPSRQRYMIAPRLYKSHFYEIFIAFSCIKSWMGWLSVSIRPL